MILQVAVLNELHLDCNIFATLAGRITCTPVGDGSYSVLHIVSLVAPDCDTTAIILNAIITSFSRGAYAGMVTCAAGGVLRYNTAASIGETCELTVTTLNAIIRAEADGTLYEADAVGGAGCRLSTPTTTVTTTLTSSGTSTETTTPTTTLTTSVTTTATTTPQHSKLQCRPDGSIVVPTSNAASCDVEVAHLNALIQACNPATRSELVCDPIVRSDAGFDYQVYSYMFIHI